MINVHTTLEKAENMKKQVELKEQQQKEAKKKVEARGIGALLDFKEHYGSYNKPSSTLSEPRNTLGKEYFKYYTGKNKFNYLDNLVSFGGDITTTGLLLNYLQNENKK